MTINLRFFVYIDSNRHAAYPLRADIKVNSLADFKYGERIIITEQPPESTPEVYVIADLPFPKKPRTLPTDREQYLDIYLAKEEQWQEFNLRVSQLATPWYGPSL